MYRLDTAIPASETAQAVSGSQQTTSLKKGTAMPNPAVPAQESLPPAEAPSARKGPVGLDADSSWSDVVDSAFDVSVPKEEKAKSAAKMAATNPWAPVKKPAAPAEDPWGVPGRTTDPGELLPPSAVPFLEPHGVSTAPPLPPLEPLASLSPLSTSPSEASITQREIEALARETDPGSLGAAMPAAAVAAPAFASSLPPLPPAPAASLPPSTSLSSSLPPFPSLSAGSAPSPAHAIPPDHRPGFADAGIPGFDGGHPESPGTDGSQTGGSAFATPSLPEPRAAQAFGLTAEGGFDPWRGDTMPPIMPPASSSSSSFAVPKSSPQLSVLPPPIPSETPPPMVSPFGLGAARSPAPEPSPQPLRTSSSPGLSRSALNTALSNAPVLSASTPRPSAADDPAPGVVIDPWDEVGGPGGALDLDTAGSPPSKFDALLSGGNVGAGAVAGADAPLDAWPSPAHVETPADQCTSLMKGARELFDLGDFSGSLDLVEKVLQIDPENDSARSYMKRNEATLVRMYQSKLGDMGKSPRQLMPPDEVIWMNMHHKAGFILAQIDGSLSYEDILEVSGMPRFDAMRILHELVQQGIIG